jgi:hypothetical protein
MKLVIAGESLEQASLKSGMDEKTGRKYWGVQELPSQVRGRHAWRTRFDPFVEVWPEVHALLEVEPGLQAITLFEELQRRYPGRFSEGQLRTLQRKVKGWRAVEGPPKEVFFAQQHYPGHLAASEFCHLDGLNVTIQGRRLAHLFYHFVLTYSNWETGSICLSESFESLSAGLQDALWELGGVPQRHRTDSLTAAVHNLPARGSDRKEVFRANYEALLDHYGLVGERIRVRQAHENGDVEQRHHRFKVALDQSLMLRGSRDFNSRDEYALYLRGLLERLNSGRGARLEEERPHLLPLPCARITSRKLLRVRVGAGSTIRVQNNVYSVASRLIGEWVDVRLGAQDLEVWYGQRQVDRLPRLRGEGRHRISYRHVIDWLVRKPGALAHYRYRQDLFPNSRFRLVYDHLQERCPGRADKEYLRILQLAARESEQGVEDALRLLLLGDETISSGAVAALVASGARPPAVTDILVAPVSLSDYDRLLELPGLLQAPCPALASHTVAEGSSAPEVSL